MKKTKTFDSGLTQYEMKKKQYLEVTPLDFIVINSDLTEISANMLLSSSNYYMLLCNERKDYSIFVLTDSYKAVELKQALQETIQNRGEIMDIYDGCQDNSWEIWVKDNEECFCYILFEYDSGVIEI